MHKKRVLLYKTLVIGVILLFIVINVTLIVAFDIVNIEHASGKSSGDDIDWWPMFRHDLQHSGYSTSKAPDTNNVLWSYKIGDSVWSSPAVADGKVYIGSRDNKVYCLDANTGGYIWSYETGSSVSSSPAVADGKVYIGSDDSNIYAFGELEPDAPSVPEIDGPTEGVPDIQYNFKFKSESPLGNDLYYWIEWADGSNSGWLGPFDSGVEITESQVWDSKGVYPVQAKAKDINGSVSSWGVLGVTIPRNKVTVNSLFQLFFDRFPLLEVFLRAMNLLR